jgi:anti-sigma factor RsiW
MNCGVVHEALIARLDGELTAAESARIDAHVDGCLACQGELAALQRLRERVRHELVVGGAAPREGSFDDLWQRATGATEQRTLARAIPFDPSRRRGRLWARGASRARTTGRRFAPSRVAIAGLAAAAGLTLVVYVAGIPSWGPMPAPRVVAPLGGAAPESPARPAQVAKSGSEPDASKTARVAQRPPQAAPDRADSDRGSQGVHAVVAEAPPEVLERPDLFVDYSIVRRLDELRHFESVMTEPIGTVDEGGAG